MSDTTTTPAPENGDDVLTLQAPRDTIQDAQKRAADKARDDFAAAVKPTLDAPGYKARHAAYDKVRLGFIEGTVSDSAADARKAAEALGYDLDNVETRKV